MVDSMLTSLLDYEWFRFAGIAAYTNNSMVDLGAGTFRTAPVSVASGSS
jgi:hypothetical protein